LRCELSSRRKVGKGGASPENYERTIEIHNTKGGGKKRKRVIGVETGLAKVSLDRRWGSPPEKTLNSKEKKFMKWHRTPG